MQTLKFADFLFLILISWRVGLKSLFLSKVILCIKGLNFIFHFSILCNISQSGMWTLIKRSGRFFLTIFIFWISSFVLLENSFIYSF